MHTPPRFRTTIYPFEMHVGCCVHLLERRGDEIEKHHLVSFLLSRRPGAEIGEALGLAASHLASSFVRCWIDNVPPVVGIRFACFLNKFPKIGESEDELVIRAIQQAGIFAGTS